MHTYTAKIVYSKNTRNKNHLQQQITYYTNVDEIQKEKTTCEYMRTFNAISSRLEQIWAPT